jgi:hypothetical protein
VLQQLKKAMLCRRKPGLLQNIVVYDFGLFLSTPKTLNYENLRSVNIQTGNVFYLVDAQNIQEIPRNTQEKYIKQRKKSKKLRSDKHISSKTAIIYESSYFRVRHSTLQNVQRAALNQGDTSNRAHLFSTCLLCESTIPYGLRDTDKAIHVF